jgi:hypothetical protein
MSIDAFMQTDRIRHCVQSLILLRQALARLSPVRFCYNLSSILIQGFESIATEFRDRRHREERKHRLNREIMAPEVRLSGRRTSRWAS